MPVVLKVPGHTIGLICDAWVQDCDVDVRSGYGHIQITVNPAAAKRFPDVEAALEFWGRPSTVRPQRDDGKPNRPLTAYTVELVTVQT